MKPYPEKERSLTNSQMNVAWKRRWFVLTDGQMHYYHHISSLPTEDVPGDLKGTITIGADTEVCGVAGYSYRFDFGFDLVSFSLSLAISLFLSLFLSQVSDEGAKGVGEGNFTIFSKTRNYYLRAEDKCD